MSDLAARLIVELVDRISGPAEKASAGLKGIRLSEEQIGKSKGLSALVDQLRAAQKDLSGVDVFKNQMKRLAELRTEFRTAQENVTRAARAFSEADAQSKNALQRGLTRARREVVESSKAYESMAAIAKKTYRDMGGDVDAALAKERALRTSVQETTDALRKQYAVHANARGEFFATDEPVVPQRRGLRSIFARRPKSVAQTVRESARAGETGGGGGGSASFLGSTFFLDMARKGLGAGADLQSQIVAAKQAGVPDDELAKALSAAYAASASMPLVSPAESFKIFREARGALMTPTEAIDLLPTLVKANALFNRGGDKSADITDLVKGAETLGLTKDNARFQKYLNSQVAAKSVLGHFLTTEETRDAARYSKAAGGLVSDRYMNLVWPTLTAEMRGSSGGQALSSFEGLLNGGLANRHTAVDQLDKMGLLEDRTKISRLKNGEIKGYTGSMVDADLLRSDPDQWINKRLLPAPQKMGKNDLGSQMETVNAIMGGNKTGANFVRLMLQQREVIEKNEALFKAAGDIATQADLLKGDPGAQLQGLGSSISGFIGVVTQPGMADAAKAMAGLSGGIASMSASYAEWARNNPGQAKTGAVVGGGLLAAGTWKALETVWGSIFGKSGGSTAGAAAGGGSFIGNFLKRFGGPLSYYQLAMSGPGDDEILAKNDAATAAARSRYGDSLVSAARKKNWHWWRGNQDLSYGAMDDESLVQQLITDRNNARDGGGGPSYRHTYSGPHSRSGNSVGGLASNGQLDALLTKAQSTKKAVEDISSSTAAPKVDSSALDELLKKIEQIKSGLMSLGSSAAAASNRVHADSGLGGM